MKDCNKKESDPMLFAQDFHVKTSRSQGEKKESKASVRDYSLKSSDSFAIFDHDMCCWRMFQISLSGEWEKFSQSFPRSGIMMSNGTAYRLRQLTPRIEGIEYSSSHETIYPTPLACDSAYGIHTGTHFKKGKFFRVDSKGTRWGMKLREAVHLLEKLDNQSSSKSKDSTGGRMDMNPEFVEWLLGYPIGYTELRH